MNPADQAVPQETVPLLKILEQSVDSLTRGTPTSTTAQVRQRVRAVIARRRGG
jgi:hypothetical protein